MPEAAGGGRAIGGPAARAFGLAAVILLLDQITKIWAVSALELYRPVEVLPFFNLTLLHNTGAAFSFLADAGGWQRWFFVGLTAVIAVGITIWLVRLRPEERLTRLCLALILGGAIGNLIDRVRLGYVVDFLDFHVAGWHWPAFNIADAAISCGAVLLIVFGLLGRS
ncbi:signal peptidase II [Halofilum ochraceum]|uniref:signal peptidase II n=1 Tax=Halofilum ochraceum TaxID=1611323 RepID=UPI0008DA6D02|nr:signal peptidase II [Halofilum ochraceum]